MREKIYLMRTEGKSELAMLRIGFPTMAERAQGRGGRANAGEFEVENAWERE